MPDDDTTPVPTVTTPRDAAPPARTPALARSSTAGSAALDRSKGAARIAGRVAGILGIVVSLLLIVGLLIGRGWAVDQVNGIAASIDDSLARGVPLLTNAGTRVDSIQAQVAEVADAAQTVASSPSPAPGLVSRLSDRLTALSSRYLPMRATYADARARVVSTLDRLAALDRIVPGIAIPPGPVDALATLDERIRAVDEAIMTMLDANATGGTVAVAAQAIADGVARLEAALDAAAAALDDASARLEAVRADVASTASTINTAITLLTIVIVLLLLYVALLHWVLFRSASGPRAAGTTG